MVHHHANGRFDWFIFEHWSVNPLREAISILYGKYRRFTFVHPVTSRIIFRFYAVLRVFVLYSHYGDSGSSKKLNGHHAFESMCLSGALISLLKQRIS